MKLRKQIEYSARNFKSLINKLIKKKYRKLMMRKIVALQQSTHIHSFHGDLQTQHAFEIHMMSIRYITLNYIGNQRNGLE